MLLALCAGNSPVTGEFPAERPVTRSIDVFYDLRQNKRLSDTGDSRRHRAHYDLTLMKFSSFRRGSSTSSMTDPTESTLPQKVSSDEDFPRQPDLVHHRKADHGTHHSQGNTLPTDMISVDNKDSSVQQDTRPANKYVIARTPNIASPTRGISEGWLHRIKHVCQAADVDTVSIHGIVQCDEGDIEDNSHSYKFLCDFCDSCFRSHKDILAHMETHIFVCTFCEEYRSFQRMKVMVHSLKCHASAADQCKNIRTFRYDIDSLNRNTDRAKSDMDNILKFQPLCLEVPERDGTPSSSITTVSQHLESVVGIRSPEQLPHVTLENIRGTPYMPSYVTDRVNLKAAADQLQVNSPIADTGTHAGLFRHSHAQSASRTGHQDLVDVTSAGSTSDLESTLAPSQDNIAITDREGGDESLRQYGIEGSGSKGQGGIDALSCVLVCYHCSKPGKSMFHIKMHIKRHHQGRSVIVRVNISH